MRGLRGSQWLNCLSLLPALVHFPFSASKPAVFPVLFVFASAHAQVLSTPFYCLLTHGNTRPPHRCRRLPENKKTKVRSDDDSPHSFCVGKPASGRIWLPLYLRSRKYKTLHAMARTSHHRNLESSTSSLLAVSTTPISYQFRHDQLLRHPRRRQLLLSSESHPSPTKRRSRLRHLWLRRAAHGQTIPALWRLCTSHLSIISFHDLNANFRVPDVIQMTTNYCVSHPLFIISEPTTDRSTLTVPRVPEKALAIAQGHLPTHHVPSGLDQATTHERRIPGREHRQASPPLHLPTHHSSRLGWLPSPPAQTRALQCPAVGPPHRAHPPSVK